MTPEQLAEKIVTTESVMDAIRHCRSFDIEMVIARAIHAERERCAAIALEEGHDRIKSVSDNNESIWGIHRAIASKIRGT